MTTLNQPKQATTYPGSTAEKRLKIASYVLIAVGIVDLIRGFMHTFNIHYAATHIAQVDLTSAMAGDFLLVMSSFGMSNYLTGVFAILIGLKAKELAPLILAIIPVTYLLGVISLRMNDVQASAAFNGQYMMFVYLAICVLAALYYYVQKWLGKDSTVISDEA
jgi:uncharacterized membrane protein